MKLNYYAIDPPRYLAGIVRYFWVLEGSQLNGIPFLHRSFADCSAEFIFYYKGAFDVQISTNPTIKTFRSGISGHASLPRRFETSSDFGMLGVYLYPFAIPQLADLPASALTNEMVDVSTLFGLEGLLLEEKVLAAKNNLERVRIVSQFIKQKIDRAKDREPLLQQTIKQIVDGTEPLSISELRNDFYLSVRQFERKFKEQSGFSPRAFLNIARFSALIKSTEKHRTNLTRMAYDRGFYDQSHFIHNFRQFSGYSPSQYFELQSDFADQRTLIDVA